MSKLFLSCSSPVANWQLNVVSFSSPVYGEISTAQTKKMAHYYPIKVNQPQIEFSVQFTSEKEYENFQRFVRQHQQNTLTTTKLVWLNWPQRNIDNWTGVIRMFKAGGMRFNFAPKATFVVDLVDSMVSHRTDLASLGDVSWKNIFGAGMGPDAVLGPPTAAMQQFVIQRTGEDLNGHVISQGPPIVNPSQPGFGPTGITTGH